MTDSSHPRTVPSSRPSLGKDLGTGLLYAFGVSVVAVLIVGTEGLTSAVGISHVSGLEQVPSALPLILAAYFLGGLVSGIALWGLRPLRRHVLGWALTGFVIGTLAYGAIGLTGVLGYYSGVNLLDLSSAQEGWDLLPVLAPTLGLLVGVPGGFYFWYKQRQRSA
jgi:hypothetical protein